MENTGFPVFLFNLRVFLTKKAPVLWPGLLGVDFSRGFI